MDHGKPCCVTKQLQTPAQTCPRIGLDSIQLTVTDCVTACITSDHHPVGCILLEFTNTTDALGSLHSSCTSQSSLVINCTCSFDCVSFHTDLFPACGRMGTFTAYIAQIRDAQSNAGGPVTNLQACQPSRWRPAHQAIASPLQGSAQDAHLQGLQGIAEKPLPWVPTHPSLSVSTTPASARLPQ